MKKNTVIRPIKESDVNKIYEIVEREFTINKNLRPEHDELREWLNDKYHIMLVADCCNEIVGFEHAYMISSSYAIIDTMFVTKSYRNRGIATHMNKKMESVLKDKKIRYVAQICVANSKETKNFLKKSSYIEEENMIWMGKNL